MSLHGDEYSSGRLVLQTLRTYNICVLRQYREHSFGLSRPGITARGCGSTRLEVCHGASIISEARNLPGCCDRIFRRYGNTSLRGEHNVHRLARRYRNENWNTHAHGLEDL